VSCLSPARAPTAPRSRRLPNLTNGNTHLHLQQHSESHTQAIAYSFGTIPKAHCNLITYPHAASACLPSLVTHFARSLPRTSRIYRISMNSLSAYSSATATSTAATTGSNRSTSFESSLVSYSSRWTAPRKSPPARPQRSVCSSGMKSAFTSGTCK
jgi:hypothetical protein